VVVAGEPEDAVVVGGEGGVLGAVGVEGGAGAVRLEAAEFDDHAVLGPVVVGLAVAVAWGVEGLVGVRFEYPRVV
jgi:hypothetical protein